MKRNLSVILLFVVNQAFPQFNSIEFRKELASVNLAEQTDFQQESSRSDFHHLSQNKPPVKSEQEVVLASLPLENFFLTSEYGFRSDPFSGERKFHRGIDLKTNRSKVFSMLHGTVASVGNDSLLGNFVKIRHGRYESTYGHLSQAFVYEGENVLPGTIVGISGSTGRATGDHLHLTVQMGREYVNPVLLIQMISMLSTKEQVLTYLSKP
jgi:murein DD-endopeptidase MepM/ murein hydrolase activator NlpD